MKYTKSTLDKLEAIFGELNYQVRYEQGSFRSGACLVNGSQVIVVNKHFTTEGKINSLIEILKQIHEKEDCLMLLPQDLHAYFGLFIAHEIA